MDRGWNAKVRAQGLEGRDSKRVEGRLRGRGGRALQKTCKSAAVSYADNMFIASFIRDVRETHETSAVCEGKATIH